MYPILLCHEKIAQLIIQGPPTQCNKALRSEPDTQNQYIPCTTHHMNALQKPRPLPGTRALYPAVHTRSACSRCPTGASFPMQHSNAPCAGVGADVLKIRNDNPHMREA